MRKVLKQLRDGKLSLEEAEKELKSLQIMELGDYAKIDISRDNRTGVPEAIFAEGKNDLQLINIIRSISANGKVIVTRLTEKRYDKLKDEIKKVAPNFKIEYNPMAQVLVVKQNETEKIGKIGIITAGTSDIPVAEEASVIANEAGCEVISAYDVGVAGIHRLFSKIGTMIRSDVKVLIVVAGMEGALPSVVAGLVDIPVIGVPTSVGYGVGEGGFTALNSMLQSCAPGIAVVNIDNGFGAAVFATTIIKSSLR
jgi:NCAIR mutase (PurE)-related protein